MAELAHENGIIIHTIGIGSAEGAPIILQNGTMLIDKSGEIVMSHLDVNTLKLIASAGGGSATIASQSDLGLSDIFRSIKDMEKQELLSEEFRSYFEFYYIPLALALLFLVIDAIILERKNKYLQKLNLFRHK
jgi:Ca-activated chloride channel family protein